MRCFQLGWMILGSIFVAENGQRSVVSGMPVDKFDGSRLCSFNSRAMRAEEQRSHIAFEILYRDTSSVFPKSTNCNLEFWHEATRLGLPPGNKKSFDHLEVQVTRENPELFKIFVDKEAQGWLESNVNSIVRIVCPNRKFNCIQFLSAEKGASPVRRSLLSIDELYMYKGAEDGIPLKSLFVLLAGAVILIIAGSLCADCNNTKDDGSISEAKPELLGCQKRVSQRTLTPDERQVEEKFVFESKDAVVMETAEKIEGDSLEADSHKPRTTITHYEPPPSSVQHEPPHSAQPPRPPSSTQHGPPTGTEHGPPVTTETSVSTSTQPVQANGAQPEAESGNGISRALKAGSSKKKRGSDSDHEEHKGKFWKRTRSTKNSNTPGTASDAVFQDEEHKTRRSRKESKELKTKFGKTKRRTSSTDSEKDEKSALHDDHTERPRVTTLTLEGHPRGLPLPPSTSSPARPARSVPQRQLSAPEGVEEDNYETVEVRKTKSMERVKASYPPEDDNYDVVQDKVGKPRLPSLDNDLTEEIGTGARTSDIYETVDDAGTNDAGNYLYAEVEKTRKEKGKSEEVVANDDVDEEDPYSKIKYGKQQEAEENSEDEEDPYSKIKYPKSEEEMESSELYEDVEKNQENPDKSHKYAAVDKVEVLRLMNQDGTITESNDRKRSQSDAVVLRRTENELPKRPNTVHVVRTTKGEVTQAEGEVTSAPFDYTYAKVDLSKKTKRRRSTEGEETTEEETWESDIPPPLPPAYVSSRQIQIEMGRTADLPTDNIDNVYDEVASDSQRERPPNMELLAPEDESNRLSSASDDYELVEVVAKPNSPIVRMTDNQYSEVVEREPRSKVGGGRARPVHVEICGAPSNISVTVTSSSEAVDGNVDNEEMSHYEQVERRKERKEQSNPSDGQWV